MGPRDDPQDAYQAFMSMSRDEWHGLIDSLARGGVLTPAEEVGFKLALKERKF